MTWLLVALGGAGGSLLRYGVGRWAVSQWGPATVMGTFIVNITGSFALGLLIGLALERSPAPPGLRNMATIGFLGGYTTFSTLSLESVRLLLEGELGRAAASIIGSVILGLSAAYLGLFLGNLLGRAAW